MRFATPFAVTFCFSLLAGCASSTAAHSTADPASTKTASSTTYPVSAQTTCAPCAAGEYCASCDSAEGPHACAACDTGQACTKCQAKHGQAVASAPSSEPVATVDATGMSCPQCASNIDRQMKKIDGINWTKIDLGKGQVVVELDPNAPTPSAEALQQAVNNAGFTAGAVTLPGDEVNP